MFPLGDDNTGRTIKPFVTWAFIALNILVFVLLQHGGMNDKFTYAFSTVPREITTGTDIVTDDRVLRHPETGAEVVVAGLKATPIPVYLTLLTAIFMHGGWAHLLGNMWFLFIFGDNVEDDTGHVRFAIFYLLTGLLASLAHVAVTMIFDGNPLIPSLGASGAISGVLGGYLVQHPRRKVRVLMFRYVQQVPGIVAVGLWFVFQVVSGLGMLGNKEGGVAYGAHIGGFVAGLVLIKLFVRRGAPRELPQVA